MATKNKKRVRSRHFLSVELMDRQLDWDIRRLARHAGVSRSRWARDRLQAAVRAAVLLLCLLLASCGVGEHSSGLSVAASTPAAGLTASDTEWTEAALPDGFTVVTQHQVSGPRAAWATLPPAPRYVATPGTTPVVDCHP